MTALRSFTAAPLLLALAACASTSSPPALPAAQEAFWDALSSHCGNAYAGGLVSSDERDADWAGKRMVAHWAECSEGEIAIAFHVEDAEEPGGWNRSRTWLVRRGLLVGPQTPRPYLSLHHDHRHDDGVADPVTFYGGQTSTAGTARLQDFPVDAFSIALFEREGLDLSLTNVWRMEVDPAGEPGARFAYQLTRRNDPARLFRVEMDAAQPIAPPPPAWGW